MKSIKYIWLHLGVVMVVATAAFTTSCTKSEGDDGSDIMPISFSTTKSVLTAETKAAALVAEGETEFGSFAVTSSDRASAATRVDSEGFEDDDKIGIYLYYNYWFDEYSESVILDDATLTVNNSSGNTLDPQKIWTFSSIGGNVPSSLHAYAYSPKSAGAVLSYGGGSALTWTHDSTVDLLIATLVYGSWNYYDESSSASQGAQFKSYLTETLSGNMALEFKHQLATLSFYIYKASEINDTITIKSLEVEYTCSEGYDNSETTNSNWSTTTTDKTNTLTVTGGGTLGTTVPTDPLTLGNEIYLPPNTVINSITFSLDISDATGTYTDSYTWHPHIVGMEVKEYQITFELDPDRNN
ncbi:MAG: hypothetical protein R3Y68_01500 [Rikenellaceae bacterium]